MPNGHVAGSAADIAEIERQEYALRPLSPQALRAAAPPAKKKKKNGALKRLAMMIRGGRYKTDWQPPERFRERPKADVGTTRTQQVSQGLRQGGLTEEEIARFR